MAKLSAQLEKKKAKETPTRTTRTERVAEQQKIARIKKAQEEIKRLREKAEQVREEKFKEKVVEEEYKVEVPDWSKISKNERRRYNKVSDKWKKQRLENWRKQGKTKYITKTREKTLPLTLNEGEHTYQNLYSELDPKLKPFFASPETLIQERSGRIEENIQKVAEKKAFADEQIVKAKDRLKRDKERYERKKERLQKQRDRRGSDWYSEKREDLADDLDKDEDKFEEEVEYWKGYKSGLGEGEKKLKQGKEVDWNSIIDYANKLGRYKKQKERARNKKREYEREYNQRLEEELGIKNPERWSEGSHNLFKKQLGGMSWDEAISDTNREIAGSSKSEWSRFSEGVQKDIAGKKYQHRYINQLKDAGKSDMEIARKLSDLQTEYKKEQQGKQFASYQQDKAKNNVIVGVPYNIGKVDFNKQEAQAFKFANKTYIPTSDIIGYADQGTISTEPKYIEVQGDVDWKKPNLNAEGDWVKKQYSKIPRGSWTLNIGSPFGLAGIAPYKDPFALKTVNITEGIGKGRDFLRGKDEEVTGDLKKIGSVEKDLADVEEHYQKQGQTRLENLYAEDIIYGRITPEKAKEEFKKTESYKEWQEQFAEDYGVTLEEATQRKNIGFKSAFKYGSKQFAYGLGDFALSRVETPKATAETGAVVGGVVLTYGQLSPAIKSAVALGVTGSTGIYGGYEAFSPTSSPSEVFGGALMLGTSGVFAGVKGYKYLKSASKVETVKIPPPKTNLKASSIVGKDIKFITNQETFSKVVYPQQKLSQIGVAGSRTVWTSTGRALFNKYIAPLNKRLNIQKVRGTGLKTVYRFKLKPSTTYLKDLYKGVPTAQQGYIRDYGFFRVTKESAYKSMYKRMLKYNRYSPSQARTTLRYTAPRVYEQSLQKGVLTIGKKGAVGEFEYLTKQPRITVDSNLGIKTRGARTIKDVYNVQRKLITLKSKQFVLEDQSYLSFFTKKGKILSVRDVGYSRSILSSKASALKKGYDVSKIDDITQFTPSEYKDVLGISFRKNLLPYDRTLTVEGSRTTLYNKVIDLSKKNYFIKPAGIKKTPLSKTFGRTDAVDDIIDKITKKQVAKDFGAVADKIDDVTGQTARGSGVSEYWGTGQYERTAGGLFPQETKGLGLQQTLRSPISPPQIKTSNLKGIIKTMSKTDLAVGVNIANLMAVKTLTGLKTKTGLKDQLKVKINMKDLMDQKTFMKTGQMPIARTSPALKSLLKTQLKITQPTPPTMKTPRLKTPDMPIPSYPAILIPELPERRKKKKRSALQQAIYERAYLPDFTSRALGLKAETMSQKQAQTKLKKIMTGFEIRRGVKIK